MAEYWYKKTHDEWLERAIDALLAAAGEFAHHEAFEHDKIAERRQEFLLAHAKLLEATRPFGPQA